MTKATTKGKIEVPTYQFDCTACDQLLEVVRPMSIGAPESVICPDCLARITRRVFHVAVQTPFAEHYNHTVGKRVSSMKQFRSDLVRASEHAEERTGIPHRFVPVDGADAAAATGADANGAGMDATNRRLVSRGERKTKMIFS